MHSLRRRFATLWPSNSIQDLQAREDGDDWGEAEEKEEGREASSPRTNGRFSSFPGTDSTPGSSRTSGKLRGEGIRDPREDKELVPATARVLTLAQPWGSADPIPPKNWSSQHHSPTMTTFHSASKRRLPRPVLRQEDTFDDSASSGAAVLSDSSSINNTADRMRTTKSEAVAAAVVNTMSGITSSTFQLVEHDEKQQTRSSTKRKQGGAAETGGKVGKPKPYRRQRTCPADSAFVSPMKRSISYATHSATGMTPSQAETAAQLLQHEDDEEVSAHHSRLFPPSHLVFRAGFFKALAGRRSRRNAAATAKPGIFGGNGGGAGGGGDSTSDSSKGRSSNRFKRRTKDLHARIARHALLSAYPPPDGSEGIAAEEAMKEAVVNGTATAAAMARRSRIEGNAIWERVNRHELEQDEEAEKRAAARRRRLEILRAENDAALEQARSANARLVAAASAALHDPAGADLMALRNIYAGDTPLAARFKDDADLVRLEHDYMELEALVSKVVNAHSSGNVNELERLLALPAASRLQTQLEVKTAVEASRVRQEAARKAGADKAAGKARSEAAAAAARAAAQSQHEADQAAAEARARTDNRKKVEEEAKEAKHQFIKEADDLNAAVQARRAASNEILASTDSGVKKIRMAFKKSYQGCLNKLASSPDTVGLVVDMIHGKAQEPLEAARRAGWDDRAKIFLYTNLADKLVGYAEGDHFNATTYEMAFPLACVSVDLMTQHPELKELFLGTLYGRCPSAIPRLSFDTAGKSNKEVMQLFGQQEDEDVSSFVGRTKGLIVLLATVMQTPASTRGTEPHPFPLAEGWRWLARFMNGLEEYVGRKQPPPPPTGPVLEWFLKICGHELQRRYGRALDKLVQTVKHGVLPSLLPKTRVPHLLDVVIEDYENNGGRFAQPAGRPAAFANFRPWGQT